MARKKKVVETIWTRDITHHIVATMAVFGLVVSSLVTTIGVATLGVEAQVAFAQNEAVSQAAAAFLADNQPVSAALLPNSSTTPPRPPMDANHVVASSTGNMSTSSMPISIMHAPFCPKIARTLNRGNNDATTTGDVGQLQMFLANHFNVTASTSVSGYFGSTTQFLLEKFQAEQGIPQAPTAGPLTRAAIVKLCGSQNNGGQNSPMGSSTPGTMPPPMPPQAPISHGDNHPSPTANTASSTVTVQVVSPNGGENYAAGSGTLTISWNASGVSQGAKACVALVSSLGKHFNFPATGESCISVSNGAGSVTAPLVLNHDYLLTPGSYTAQVTIISTSGSNNSSILAKDSSDAAFTLDDSELGVNTLVPADNASNAASMVNAVSEIGDGYTKLFEATLASFGL